MFTCINQPIFNRRFSLQKRRLFSSEYNTREVDIGKNCVKTKQNTMKTTIFLRFSNLSIRAMAGVNTMTVFTFHCLNRWVQIKSNHVYCQNIKKIIHISCKNNNLLIFQQWSQMKQCLYRVLPDAS